MNDNDDVPQEVKEVVEKGVQITAILCSIEDTEMASKALSVAVAHLLCFRMSSESAAHDLMNKIIDDIDSAVMLTKKYSCTSWHEGTPH